MYFVNYLAFIYCRWKGWLLFGHNSICGQFAHGSTFLCQRIYFWKLKELFCCPNTENDILVHFFVRSLSVLSCPFLFVSFLSFLSFLFLSAQLVLHFRFFSRSNFILSFCLLSSLFFFLWPSQYFFFRPHCLFYYHDCMFLFLSSPFIWSSLLSLGFISSFFYFSSCFLCLFWLFHAVFCACNFLRSFMFVLTPSGIYFLLLDVR